MLTPLLPPCQRVCCPVWSWFSCFCINLLQFLFHKPPEMAHGRRIFISVHSINGIVVCVCTFSSAVSFAWDRSGLFMYHLQPRLAWAICLFFWFDFCSFWNFYVLNQTARALLKQKLWVRIFPPVEETGAEQLPSLFLQCCREATKCCNWQKDVPGRSKKPNIMAEGVTADTKPVCQLVSLTGTWAFFNGLSEPQRVIMSSRGQDKTRAFSFAHPLFYWILLFFQSRWLGGFCTMKRCIPSSCMCGASIHESDFFSFLIPPPPQILPFWPDEEQRHWVQAAGAEAAWLSEDPAMSLSVWFGRALVSPWAPPVLGWPGLCSPFHPTLWSCSFKSNKQTARRCAVGEIAAPVGHCNGSNPMVTQAFISLYGFNFGKCRAAGFLQVAW